MALQGSPALSADGTSVTATVELTNNGKVMLTSTDTKPVNLGAHSADASGNIVNNDLVHASIPDIAVGSQAAVTIQFPMDQVIGKTVQIVPVQEGVVWLNTLGIKVLIVGRSAAAHTLQQAGYAMLKASLWQQRTDCDVLERCTPSLEQACKSEDLDPYHDHHQALAAWQPKKISRVLPRFCVNGSPVGRLCESHAARVPLNKIGNEWILRRVC